MDLLTPTSLAAWNSLVATDIAELVARQVAETGRRINQTALKRWATHWRDWKEFTDRAGRPAMPMAHDLVARFLAEGLSEGVTYRSLRSYLATFVDVHQAAGIKPPWGEDVTDPSVVMWGHFRRRGPARVFIDLPKVAEEVSPEAPQSSKGSAATSRRRALPQHGRKPKSTPPVPVAAETGTPPGNAPPPPRLLSQYKPPPTSPADQVNAGRVPEESSASQNSPRPGVTDPQPVTGPGETFAASEQVDENDLELKSIRDFTAGGDYRKRLLALAREELASYHYVEVMQILRGCVLAYGGYAKVSVEAAVPELTLRGHVEHGRVGRSKLLDYLIGFFERLPAKTSSDELETAAPSTPSPPETPLAKQQVSGASERNQTIAALRSWFDPTGEGANKQLIETYAEMLGFPKGKD